MHRERRELLNRRAFLKYTAALGALGAVPYICGRARAASLGPQAAPDDTLPEEALGGPQKGPWRRLFLDAAVLEEQKGLKREFPAAEVYEQNPVIKADRKWEGTSAISGPYVYGSVMWDGGKLRIWYQVLNKGNHVGYAESKDGISWTKPDLGIISYEGSKANNLVVSAFEPAVTGGQCHNPSVLKLPPGNPNGRYALYGFDGEAGHARVAFSQDGLHWRYAAETKERPLFKSSDVVNFFYDTYAKRFAATWKTRNRRGRAAGVTWSEDGLTWTKPFDGPVFVADDLDPDATQIYGMPVFPYQGLYLGMPWIYNARYFRFGEYSVKKLHEAQEDSPRTMDVQLAWSWDLVNWTRPPVRGPFIPRGQKEAWDSGMIYTARAPVIVGDKLYFYYGGCRGLHDDKQVSAAIGLATLRLDGFCCLRAQDAEGSFISRREPFHTPAVTINALTGAGGYVCAEILNRKNRVVPGFSRQDCNSFQGDTVRHRLTWKSQEFPSNQRHNDYKLRFFLKNAAMYSYLPEGLDPAENDLARF